MSWRTTWAPSTEPRPAGSERGPRPGQPPGTQAHTGQTGCRGRRLASDPGSRGHPVPTDRGGLVAGQHPFVWKGSLYLRFCIYTWCKCTYIETLSVQTLTTPQATLWATQPVQMVLRRAPTLDQARSRNSPPFPGPREAPEALTDSRQGMDNAWVSGEVKDQPSPRHRTVLRAPSGAGARVTSPAAGYLRGISVE